MQLDQRDLALPYFLMLRSVACLPAKALAGTWWANEARKSERYRIPRPCLAVLMRLVTRL